MFYTVWWILLPCEEMLHGKRLATRCWNTYTSDRPPSFGKTNHSISITTKRSLVSFRKSIGWKNHSPLSRKTSIRVGISHQPRYPPRRVGYPQRVDLFGVDKRSFTRVYKYTILGNGALVGFLDTPVKSRNFKSPLIKSSFAYG